MDLGLQRHREITPKPALRSTDPRLPVVAPRQPPDPANNQRRPTRALRQLLVSCRQLHHLGSTAFAICPHIADSRATNTAMMAMNLTGERQATTYRAPIHARLSHPSPMSPSAHDDGVHQERLKRRAHVRTANAFTPIWCSPHEPQADKPAHSRAPTWSALRQWDPV